MRLNPFSAMRRRRELRAQAQALDETSPLFRLFAGVYASHTGISVTSDSAVASVAVLACLIVRAESLMLCPADVIRKEGSDRITDESHPAAALIADEWNPFLGAEEGWRWKQIREDLFGNAYVRVEWRRGKPVALWPMTGPKPQILYGNGRMIYRYSGDGRTPGQEEMTPAGDYPGTEIMHFKGPFLRNPYEARSLVEVTAENIGLGIATEQFFARFLGNGSHFPQYLQTDSTLSDKDYQALKEQLKDGAGLLDAGTLRIFDRGLKVMQNEMSLKDADLSGHQRWILEQTCRTWRTPLAMVQDLTHGTYTNSEQQDLWFGKHTVTPICKNTEGVCRRRLFLPSERRNHIARFNVDGLMRGDFKTRSEGYSLLIQCGVLSPNEARAFEEWNAYDGGEEHRVALNTGPPGTASGSSPSALTPLLVDAVGRIAARARQDRDRGRDTVATLEFAHRVMAPLEAVYRDLGGRLDAEGLIVAALEEE